MEVMNCRSCKRLFNYITGPMICPACKRNGCLRTAVKDMDPTGKAVFYG